MYRRERIKIKTYLRHKIENVIDIKELFALEYLDFDGKYKNYSVSLIYLFHSVFLCKFQ